MAQIAATSSCVSHRTVTRILAAAPTTRNEQDVVRALADLDVRVRDLPTLPGVARASVAPSLHGLIERLRLRLSIQLPFGPAVRAGFRVLDGFALEDGRILDAAVVAEARSRTAETPDPAAAEALLDQLAAIVAEQGIEELVIWEVVHRLRGLRAAGFGHRELTTQAALLGLVRAEAEVLAAALVEEADADLPEPMPRADPTAVAPAGVDDLPPHATRTHWPDIDAAPEPVPPDTHTDTDTRPYAYVDAHAEPDVASDPVPATDAAELELEVRPGRPGLLAITWAVPAGSDVALRRAAHPPAALRGDVVDIAAVWRHGNGEPTNGAVRGADGRWTRQIPVPVDVAHLTVYAVRRQGATVGPTVALSEAQPVRGLQVNRFGREARLGWGWPQDAVAAEVTLTPAGSAVPARTLTCNRRGLERGLHVDIGHRGWTFSVRAVYGYESNRVLAPPATFELPAMGVPVRYKIKRRRLRRREPSDTPGVPGRRWHYDVRVTVEDDCRLPGLFVVESTAETRPAKPSAGITVASSSPQDVTAGEVVVIPVDLSSAGPSWLALVVDPTATAGCDDVAIEHPPESESRRY